MDLVPVIYIIEDDNAWGGPDGIISEVFTIEPLCYLNAEIRFRSPKDQGSPEDQGKEAAIAFERKVISEISSLSHPERVFVCRDLNLGTTGGFDSEQDNYYAPILTGVLIELGINFLIISGSRSYEAKESLGNQELPDNCFIPKKEFEERLIYNNPIIHEYLRNVGREDLVKTGEGDIPSFPQG